MKKNLTKIILSALLCAGIAAATACSGNTSSESASADSSASSTVSAGAETSAPATQESAPASESETSASDEWTDCGDDLDRGAEVSGVSFKPEFSNYWVSAKPGAIKVTYPVYSDENGSVDISIIKTSGDNGDMSGLDTTAAETTVTLSNGAELSAKADGDVIYSAWFSAESGSFTIFRAEGMTAEQAEGAYNAIVNAESKAVSEAAWIPCDTFEAAAALSGITFEPVLSNFVIYAQPGIIRVDFPKENDSNEMISLVKSSSEGDASGISGYDETTLTLSNGVELTAKVFGDTVYSAWFGAESGYYTIYDSIGMTSAEVESAYDIIANAEASDIAFPAETAEG